VGLFYNDNTHGPRNPHGAGGRAYVPLLFLRFKTSVLLVCLEQVYSSLDLEDLYGSEKIEVGYCDSCSCGIEWCEHCLVIDRNVLYTGKAFDPDEIESALEAVTAKTVREVCMKYIYDQCPALVGYGEYQSQKCKKRTIVYRY